jgi:hypothetical protein
MGKRQDFIDLYRSGKGTRQKYIDLSGNYFRRKSRQGVLDPFKPLTILDMLQSGAFARDLKHGGIASLAHGGRIGLGAGSKRTRHAKDYESYARPSDYWEQSTNYPWYPKGYNKDIDDFRTMQKERFMYGKRKSLSNFEQIWSDVKGLLNKKAKGGLAGILNL